jgi:ATP-dependent Zn protease
MFVSLCDVQFEFSCPPFPFGEQVQMDGFEDNAGIVLLGATNRPGAIDSALIRPGRFDRILYMPLPDAAGRAKILQVRRASYRFQTMTQINPY